MGTRKFCDQCGTTTSQLTSYFFGVKPEYTTVQAGPSLFGASGLQSANAISTYPGSNKAYGFDEVELCEKCGPIWLDRVKKLTTASDPK